MFMTFVGVTESHWRKSVRIRSGVEAIVAMALRLVSYSHPCSENRPAMSSPSLSLRCRLGVWRVVYSGRPAARR